MSNPAPAQPSRIQTRPLAIFLIVAVLVATALRVPGLFTNFWCDEIWSWWLAGHIHSAAGVVLSETAHIDNNHPLATLFLYLMGQNQPVWVYRLPALVAGVGCVLIATRMMLRQGKAEAIIAALLFTFSYPLIFYSSEARGYSFVVLFSLLSFDFLQKSLRTPSQKAYISELLFGVCCVLGFLSHLMFINTYTAAIAWSLVRVRQLEPTTGLRLLRLARLHIIPVLFVLWFFNVFVKNLVDGGAPPTSPAAVLLQTLSLTLGGGDSGPLAGLAAAIVLLIFVAALVYLARQPAVTWIFFLFAIVIAPAMMCTRALYFNARPQPLMPRYFLISIAMLFLCICPLLAHLWRRSQLWRQTLAWMLALYVIGNLWNLGSFLNVGRGHYAEALAHIAAQTPPTAAQPGLALSSDNPIRTELLLRFYGPRIFGSRPITVSTDPQPWLIFNRFNADAAPAIRYGNHVYELSGIYPSSALSGWMWQVYHSQEVTSH
jgi:hypothetical protein